MKKSLALLFSIIMFCTLFGCASNGFLDNNKVSKTNTTDNNKVQYNYAFTKDGKIIAYEDVPNYDFVDEDEAMTVNSYGFSEDKKLIDPITNRYQKAKDNNNFVVQNYLEGVSIVQYVGDDEIVSIPETLNGKPMLKLGGYYKNYSTDKEPIYRFRPAIDCSKIKKIILPSTIKEIVNNSFHTVSYVEEDFSEDVLETIEVSADNEFFSSENGLLYNKDKSVLLGVPSNNKAKKLSINENTVTAYEIVSVNTEILNISKNLKQIEAYEYMYDVENPFEHKSTTYVFGNAYKLKEIIVDSENGYFSSDNGVLYNKDFSELIIYPFDKENECFVIPDTVKKVDDFCINDINNINTFVFGKNIEKIECYALESVDAAWTVEPPTLKNVKGYKNTVAEKYAKENNIKFVALD